MTNQASHIANLLEYIAGDVLEQLRSVPEPLLNQPLALPETNTLFALATHLVGAGEQWVLMWAGGRTIARDRASEFHATGTLAELEARYERWIADVHAMLDTMPDTALERVVESAQTGWFRHFDGPPTVHHCLLHAVEHSALHQGHIQLTCQLLRHQAASPAE